LRLIKVRSAGAKFVDGMQSASVALTLRSWERIFLGLKRYPTGEDIRTVLYKTLIANASLGAQTSSEQPDLERLYSSFRKQYAMPLGLRPNINIEQHDLENAQLYYLAMMDAAYGRRVFVSQHGYSTYQLIIHKPRLARTPTFTLIYKRINCARTISLNLMKITSFKSSKLSLLINKISSDFYWPIISIFGMPPFCYNDSLNSLPYTQIELREEIIR
jgi:hypothetical protein